jgi:hypothetical protein
MLSDLDKAVERSNAILDKAEMAGMEVGDAKLKAGQAHDALVKSRVTIHTFNPAALEQDVKPGMKLAKQTYASGQDALRERNIRREGLAASLAAVLIMLVGLKLYIRAIERD